VTRLALALLAVLTSAAALTPDQARLLEEARAAAVRYSDWLPNLTCTERVRRSVDWQGKGVWVRADDLVLEVTYSRRGETYKVLSRAGRPADTLKLENVAGAISKGEFGSTLRWIFEPSAAAAFEWSGRERVRGRRVEVFTYKVGVAGSRLELRAFTRSVIAGFHGRVWIDPDTKLVLRLSLFSAGPENFPVAESYAVIEYDWAAIAGKRYLVPVHAETGITERVRRDPLAPLRPEQGSRTVKHRNRMEFRDYREFKADSKITFDSQ
jgi:hypothetical protein